MAFSRWRVLLDVGIDRMVPGDFDCDGHIDLAVFVGWIHLGTEGQVPPGVTSSIRLLRGDSKGQFAVVSNLPLDWPESMPLASGDLDGDGCEDLVLGAKYRQKAVTLRGTRSGVFAVPSQPIALARIPGLLLVNDATGDGRADLVCGARYVVQVHSGRGDGSFERARSHTTGGVAPNTVEVSDMDGDGRPDLVVAHSDTNDVMVLRGVAGGGFTRVHRVRSLWNPSAYVGDFNRDGRADVVITEAGHGNGGDAEGTRVVVEAATGKGGFATASEVRLPPPLDYTSAVGVADVDGDGVPDLVLEPSRGGSEVVVLFAKGDGGFEAPTVLELGCAVRDVGLADVNHDGRADVLAFCEVWGPDPARAGLNRVVATEIVMAVGK